MPRSPTLGKLQGEMGIFFFQQRYKTITGPGVSALRSGELGAGGQVIYPIIFVGGFVNFRH